MIIIGLFITFFTSYKRIWVRVTKNGEKTQLDVTGRTNKNPVGLERELQALIRRLKIKLRHER
jgi:hypothetical protein